MKRKMSASKNKRRIKKRRDEFSGKEEMYVNLNGKKPKKQRKKDINGG